MSSKERKFADDGWAVWIDGEDTSTVYINNWLNPKGNSYVDLAIRVRGIKSTKSLNVYIPFSVLREEIDAILSVDDGNMSDVYICHLRRKLDNKLGLKLIYTIRGKGYMLKN